MSSTPEAVVGLGAWAVPALRDAGQDFAVPRCPAGPAPEEGRVALAPGGYIAAATPDVAHPTGSLLVRHTASARPGKC